MIVLEFLKDLYLETQGLDVEKMKEERYEKIELERSQRIILSAKTKKYIIIMAAIFIIIHLLSVVLSGMTGDVASLIKSVFMCILAFITIICFLIKSKQAEVAGIVCTVAVVVLSFLVPLF